VGYMCHNAVIVTGWREEDMISAHDHASKLANEHGACWVSPLSPQLTNGYQSFFVAPDGSKEGWAESKNGDAVRHGLIEWLQAHRYSDGSSSMNWVEIQFADDGGDNRILRQA
jgi:hypothetical protein